MEVLLRTVALEPVSSAASPRTTTVASADGACTKPVPVIRIVDVAVVSAVLATEPGYRLVIAAIGGVTWKVNVMVMLVLIVTVLVSVSPTCANENANGLNVTLIVEPKL